MSHFHARENGDLWTDETQHPKPVLYRVKGKWMVASMRTAEELSAIARYAEQWEREHGEDIVCPL